MSSVQWHLPCRLKEEPIKRNISNHGSWHKPLLMEKTPVSPPEGQGQKSTVFGLGEGQRGKYSHLIF